ncbi:MAG: hypothetical protein EB027_06465, partial [Actinobacteria bacterium]|nr:hypothetical protein [Actinomycetota bacterium]
MPAIHIGGLGWSLVRQWPERAAAEPWQHQLQALLRGHMLCRELLWQAEQQPVDRVSIDWAHPGIGKAPAPTWDRASGRRKGAPVADFTMNSTHVSFFGGGTRRGGASSSTSVIVTGSSRRDGPHTCRLTLESPVR